MLDLTPPRVPDEACIKRRILRSVVDHSERGSTQADGRRNRVHPQLLMKQPTAFTRIMIALSFFFFSKSLMQI